MSSAAKRRFVCAYCPKAFAVKQSCENHERKHTGEKPFKCTYCSKWFAHRSTLNNHERIHSGEKPFQCDKCFARFTTQSALLNHQRGVHASSKSFICEICGKAFAMKTGLQQHMRVHQRKRERELQRSLMSMQKLNAPPKPKYTPKRAFCDYCDKSFTRPCRLKLHMRTKHNVDRVMVSQDGLIYTTHQKFTAVYPTVQVYDTAQTSQYSTVAYHQHAPAAAAALPHSASPTATSVTNDEIPPPPPPTAPAGSFAQPVMYGDQNGTAKFTPSTYTSPNSEVHPVNAIVVAQSISQPYVHHQTILHLPQGPKNEEEVPPPPPLPSSSTDQISANISIPPLPTNGIFPPPQGSGSADSHQTTATVIGSHDVHQSFSSPSSHPAAVAPIQTQTTFVGIPRQSETHTSMTSAVSDVDQRGTHQTVVQGSPSSATRAAYSNHSAVPLPANVVMMCSDAQTTNFPLPPPTLSYDIPPPTISSTVAIRLSSTAPTLESSEVPDIRPVSISDGTSSDVGTEPSPHDSKRRKLSNGLRATVVGNGKKNGEMIEPVVITQEESNIIKPEIPPTVADVKKESSVTTPQHVVSNGTDFEAVSLKMNGKDATLSPVSRAKFATDNGVRSTMMKRRGGKNTCSRCQKKFKSENALQIHIGNHQGENNCCPVDPMDTTCDGSYNQN